MEPDGRLFDPDPRLRQVLRHARRLAPPRRIPWSLVARIDERVQLAVGRDDLTATRESGETATARDDIVVLERKR